MRSKQTFFSLILIFLFGLPGFVVGEEIRDYYAEPGLNPFKEDLRDLNESIDPFSGILQQKYLDLMIPGDGGLDIRVNRVYTSLQDSQGVGTRTMVGVGWTMHLGRIVVPTAHRTKICAQSAWSVTVSDNPSLEFADGGRELLVLWNGDNQSLITKSNWKADCVGMTNGGMRVTSPNGTVYYMDVAEYAADAQTGDQYSWYTSRIEDLDGNWIQIDYDESSASGDALKYISSITASDGRVVTFDYHDAGTSSIRLKSITANGQTWLYDYEPLSMAGSRYQLTRVTRPDGLTWDYTYYPQLSAEDAGSYSMESVTYPHGARVDYTYQLVDFDLGSAQRNTAIHTKSTSGPNVTAGHWTYEFEPSTTIDVYDKTTVYSPIDRTEYRHSGYNTQVGAVWPIGLLVEKSVYSVDGSTLVEYVGNFWNKRDISIENYWHGPRSTRLDNDVSVPLLESASHLRDGAWLVTHYFDHDEFGHPGRIEQTRSSDQVRVTRYTYRNDTLRWLIGLPLTEDLEGIPGIIEKDYSVENGRLKYEDHYGVRNHYAYDPKGNLKTETNARGFVTTYRNHKLGIAQAQEQQISTTKSITTHRAVNPTGTIAWQEDGLGHRTLFTYDGMNRLKTIDFPIHDDVSIAYFKGRRQLTRGAFQQIDDLNGFGKVIRSERRDLASGESIYTTKRYDELGRVIFESYANADIGVTTEYDELHRPVRVTQGDGAVRTIDYGQFLEHSVLQGRYLADTRVTNERGNISYSLKQCFGSWDNCLGVVSLINDINHTVIERDHLGLVQKVTQGESNLAKPEEIQNPLVRDYQYDDHRFLTSINNPETGLTVYGRDEVGNKTSVKVDSSPTTGFHYDGANRLYLIDYPPGTNDVSIGYDDNHRVESVDKGTTQWTYDYDENGNFTKETLTIGDEPAVFQFLYGYDALDALATITYPNGVQVDYAPNALGRPTQAEPFATHVSYHPNGQAHEIILQNGVTSVATLNTRQFVEGLTVQRGAEAAFVDYFYHYDETGNVEDIEDRAGPNSVGPLVYDELDRLVEAPGPWGNADFFYTGAGDLYAIGFDRAFDYDDADGKRQLRSVRVYLGGEWLPGINVRHDVYGNQLNNWEREFRYDDASNLIAAAVDLSLGTDSTYEYDGNDQRFRELGEGGKRFTIYGKSGKLLIERDGTGCEDKAYVYLGTILLARESRLSTADDNGNQVTDCLEYDPDGDGLSNLEEDANQTARNRADTDNDGMDDGFEVAVNGLDPTNSGDAVTDLDQDGVPNLQEYLDQTSVDDPGDFINTAPVAHDDARQLLLSEEEYPAHLSAAPGVLSGAFDHSAPWHAADVLRQPNGTPFERVDALAVGTDGKLLAAARIDSPQASEAEIAAVFLDQDGQPIGEQFAVSASPTTQLYYPQVTALDDGYVVVWSDWWGNEIVGRLVSRSGALGSPFVISSGGTYDIFHPKVAKTFDGGFVVTWQAYDWDEQIGARVSAIKARQYDAAGNPVTAELEVRGRTEYAWHRAPAVAALPAGGFVVVWWVDETGEIRGRRFSSTGEAQGPEFLVEDSRGVDGLGIAALPNNGFFVVWAGEYLSGNYDYTEIAGRVFDPQGTPIGASFILNQRTFGKQVKPMVRLAGADEVIVAWGEGSKAFTFPIDNAIARRFTASGDPTTDEYHVAYTAGWEPNAILIFADGSQVISSPVRGGTRFETRHAGEEIAIDVLRNDDDPDSTDTPDRLAVVAAAVREGPGHGNVSVTDNTVMYSAGADFDHLAQGESETIHIDYSVADDSHATDEGTVVLKLSRSVPVFVDDFEAGLTWDIDPYQSDTSTEAIWEWRYLGYPSDQVQDLPSPNHALVTDRDGMVGVLGRTSVQSSLFAVPRAQKVELSLWSHLRCDHDATNASGIKVSLMLDGAPTPILDETCRRYRGPHATNGAVAGRWNHHRIDISDYAGRSTRVLIEANGSGANQYAEPIDVVVDDVKVLAREVDAKLVFFDDFELGIRGPWSELQLGEVAVVEDSTAGWVLRKSMYDDPNGGFAPLDRAVTDFEMILQTRKLDASASDGNRYSLTDAAGNGYGVSLDYPTGELIIERRDGWVVSALGISPAAVPGGMPLGQWYTLKWSRLGDQLVAEVFEGLVDPSTSTAVLTVAAADPTYTRFTQVNVNGSHVFDTDNLQVIEFAVAQPLTVDTDALPNGALGVAYSEPLSAHGGAEPYTWSVASGSLPAGLALNSAGVLSGTPSAVGTYNFTLTVMDDLDNTATRDYSVVVAEPLIIETTTLADGMVGQAYLANLSATGGVGPYTWSLATGTLPSGLVLDANGDFSGTPVTDGGYAFTVQVVDQLQSATTKALSMTIQPANHAPSVSIDTPTSGSVYTEGVTFSLSATATDPEDGDLSALVNWSSDRDGGLGNGASLPVTLSVGAHTLTASVTDSSGETASAQIGVTIKAAPVNTSPSVSIDTPASGSVYAEGVTITLSATATDPEDGDLSALVNWSSDRDGGLGNGASLPVTLSVGVHTLTASVTDSGGASADVQIGVTIEPAIPSGVIDLNSYPLASFSNQDGQGTATVEDGGATLHLTGNVWKRIDFPYTVTPQTVIEFDFSADAQGEIHGVALEENNNLSSSRIFKVHGTQRYGIRDFDDYPGSGWVRYRIPVGQYYTGNFAYLVFVMDDDAAAAGDSRFRNVRVFEEGGPPHASPSVTIDTPASGSVYTEGATVDLSATASDPEDGDLSASVSWSSDLDGGLGSGASLPVTLSVGVHTLTASVIDSGGATASAQISVTIQAAAPSGVIDFNSYPLSSFSNQDRQGTPTVEDSGDTLHLTGNLWKRIDFPYTVTPQTVIEFDFSADAQGEIHGIALEENNSLSASRIFKVHGTQSYGIRDFDDYPGSGWVHYRIPVGQYYTGSFAYLVFVMDDDAAAAGDSRFRNVQVYD